jgi:hypothetical protein
VASLAYLTRNRYDTVHGKSEFTGMLAVASGLVDTLRVRRRPWEIERKRTQGSTVTRVASRQQRAGRADGSISS